MDATIAYQKVDHHVNPEVDAMLGMYEIGVIKQPDFGQEWGVALSPRGMRVITLRDAYAAWVDFLFMVVEIENAVTNDFRVRGEPFADIETPKRLTMTPSKMQQLILAHERLVTSYLDHILGEPIETLWALTVGLTGQPNLDVRWMRQTLMHLKASPHAHTVLTVADEVRTHLKNETGSVEAFNRICAYLEYEDAYMLNNLKQTLREGIKTFESMERETIRHGSGRLVAVLQRVPAVLEEFHKRLAVSLSATV
jgi:sulfite reductase (NADPH) flavoprotein alpha-component